MAEGPRERPRPSGRRRMLRALVFCAAAAVVLMVVAYLGAGLVIYDRLSRVSPGGGVHASNTPTSFAVHGGGWEGFDASPYLLPRYEKVRVASRQEGIELACWYIETKPSAPAVVLVHGLADCKGSHAVLIPAGMLWRAGFSVLLIDMRDHGESDVEDGRVAVGSEEYLDVLGAWDWLVARGLPPERIGLFGTSLGAAGVLIAAGQEGRVRAAFCDSPFASALTIIEEELERNGYPTFLARAGVLMGRLVSGDDLLAHSPEEALGRLAGRPLFVVHGLADTRVGVHHARRLESLARERGEDVTIWLVPDGEHLEAVLRHPGEYERRLVGFFRSSLGAGEIDRAQSP